jgi:hypothetical protein
MPPKIIGRERYQGSKKKESKKDHKKPDDVQA